MAALQTALQHVCSRVPVGQVAQCVGDFRGHLVGTRQETVSLVVVCDHERVVGVISLRDVPVEVIADLRPELEQRHALAERIW